MLGAQESMAEPMTAEQLLTYHAPDRRVELVHGRIVVREPPGWQHGEVLVRLSMRLGNHLAQEQQRHGWGSPRGRLASGDPGFTLFRNPDTVRAPDLAYVSRERHSAAMPRGFPDFAPDLAVEIRSPTDRPGALLAKVSDWLEAGSRLVWIIDPGPGTATVYRADGTLRLLGADDALDGEDLLPGFICPLRALVQEA